MALVVGCGSSETSSSSKSSTGSGGASNTTAQSSSTSGAGGAGGSGLAGSTSTSSSSSSSTSSASSSSSGSDGGAIAGLHVEGNTLVDNGKTVRLLGVDHSGTEYQCVNGQGIFDAGGGAPTQAFVNNMLTWHVNTVRVPLNEDCWLGLNGVAAQYSGSTYQTAIAQYVSLLRQSGLYVIVDLHWNAPGTNKATGQLPMADLDHAPAFWTSVAQTFMSDQGVVFDLYNEPYVASWSCWLSGCMTTTALGNDPNPYPTTATAGMQGLLTAVRATGALNVVMAGGLNYAGDLTQWLANEPSDPAGNLVASFHSYNFSNCHDSACWTSQLQPVAAQVPLVTGELGENDCAATYIDGFMDWADGAGVSYLGWAWNADFSCSGGPSLISNFNGTPTAFGAGLQTHLQAIN